MSAGRVAGVLPRRTGSALLALRGSDLSGDASSGPIVFMEGRKFLRSTHGRLRAAVAELSQTRMAGLFN